MGSVPVERLVEEQHLGIVDQGRRHLGPLPHALRIGGHPAVGLIGQLHGLEDPAGGAGRVGGLGEGALHSMNRRAVMWP